MRRGLKIVHIYQVHDGMELAKLTVNQFGLILQKNYNNTNLHIIHHKG